MKIHYIERDGQWLTAEYRDIFNVIYGWTDNRHMALGFDARGAFYNAKFHPGCRIVTAECEESSPEAGP